MENNEPKIILFDLETIPNLPEALKVWPQLSNYPSLTLRATISTILCIGYKELGSHKTHCLNLWDFKEWKKNVNDDYPVVKAFYDIISKADAVVTHNGKRFDWKFLQTRLKKNGLQALGKIPHIDTKELASRNLYSFNNRLGYLGEWLVDDKKLDHEGWELWVKSHSKDPKALNKMERYCKQDVKLLEKIFKELRCFATNIPNHNLYIMKHASGKPVCPQCGSTRLRSNGYRGVGVRAYKRLKCLDCGAWPRLDAKGNMPRAT